MMTIGFILFSLLGISSAINFKVLRGRPKFPELGQMSASTGAECLNKIIDKYKINKNLTDYLDYAAAFLHGSSLCKAYHLFTAEIWLLNVNRSIKSILEENNDEHQWVTLFPKLYMPLILWPLNEIEEGKNYGTGRKSFDLSTRGNCDFNKIYSDQRVCRVREQAVGASVPIVQNGRRIFDFSKDFTLALFIKLYKTHHNITHHQLLIGSSPINAGRLELFPSFSQMSLALSENDQERDITTIDSSDALQWRFLTVTYKAPNDVKFFLNGEEWPMLHKRMPIKPKIIPSTHIRMFKGYEGVRTYGIIAYVAILQRALSQRKVQDMKRVDYSHK